MRVAPSFHKEKECEMENLNLTIEELEEIRGALHERQSRFCRVPTFHLVTLKTATEKILTVLEACEAQEAVDLEFHGNNKNMKCVAEVRVGSVSEPPRGL